MGIRDEEIKRLINYAKGHGLKVTMKTAKHGERAAAAWLLDGSEIEIYIKSNACKTDLIMTLIHELGHHMWWVRKRNRKPDLKFEAAIERMWNAYAEKKRLGKPYRRKILNTEKAGAKWWLKIYKDVGIKVPEWKLHMNMEFDLWQYQVYYETGIDPKRGERRAKRRELTAKWKPTKTQPGVA